MFRLPPRFGMPPPKIVFLGLPASSREARAIARRYEGEIARFQNRARQAAVLGGTGSSFMQQQLPGGSRMRYSFNQGLETIHIQVTEKDVIEAREVEEPPPLPRKAWLAIDVLLNLQEIKVGDITSYEEIEGEPEDDWHNESDWEFLWGSSLGDGFFNLYGSYHGTPNWFWSNDPNQVDSAPGSGYSPTNANPGGVWGVVDFGYQGDALAPLIVRAKSRDGTDLATDNYVVERAYAVPQSGGGGGGTHKEYERDVYYYFNTLVVTAVRDDKDPGNYAVSTGDSGGIVRALTSGEIATANREANIGTQESSDTVDGMAGAGFLVELDEATDEVREFGIYMASVNITVENQYPDAEGVEFGTDHPSMTYDVDQSVQFDLQARGYNSDAVVSSVGVDLATTRRHVHYVADEPDSEPLTEVGREELSSERTTAWGFAAEERWEDTGGPPADPAAPGMGDVLATAISTTTVSGPSDVGREVPDEVSWTEGIDGMTRVATIKWTPATIAGETGEAEITIP